MAIFPLKFPLKSKKVTDTGRSGRKSKTKSVLKSVMKMEHKKSGTSLDHILGVISTISRVHGRRPHWGSERESREGWWHCCCLLSAEPRTTMVEWKRDHLELETQLKGNSTRRAVWTNLFVQPFSGESSHDSYNVMLCFVSCWSLNLHLQRPHGACKMAIANTQQSSNADWSDTSEPQAHRHHQH